MEVPFNVKPVLQVNELLLQTLFDGHGGHGIFPDAGLYEFAPQEEQPVDVAFNVKPELQTKILLPQTEFRGHGVH